MNDPLIVAGVFMSIIGIITILVTNYMQNHKENHSH